VPQHINVQAILVVRLLSPKVKISLGFIVINLRGRQWFTEWWRSAWVGSHRWVLFIQMRQYLLDGCMLCNAGDYFDIRFCTRFANVNVDIEYSLQPLRPTHAAGMVRLIWIFRMSCQTKTILTTLRSRDLCSYIAMKWCLCLWAMQRLKHWASVDSTQRGKPTKCNTMCVCKS